MCFYKYQAAFIVDEYGLEEMFPTWSREQLIDDIGTNCAGGYFDLGPPEFADEDKRDMVVGHLVRMMTDDRRKATGGKRGYEHQIEATDQVLNKREKEALDEMPHLREFINAEMFEAEVRSFDDRREMQEKYG